MNTLLIIIIGGIVLAGTYLWVKNSDNPFASAIRAQIPFLSKQAGEAIDSVKARTTTALLEQRGIVTGGRIGLHEIQMLLAEIELDLKEADEEIADDKAAAALAHKDGDRTTFDEIVEELNKDIAFQNELVEDREAVLEDLQALEVEVDEEREKEKLVASEGRRLVSKSRRETIIAEINEQRAGLGKQSHVEEHMEAARESVKKTTARAMASKQAALGLTPGERTERKVEAYMKQAKAGAGSVSSESLWAEMETSAQQ